jgi:hypothetical protein
MDCESSSASVSISESSVRRGGREEVKGAAGRDRTSENVKKIFNNFQHDELMTVRKPDTNAAIPILAICVNNKGVLFNARNTKQIKNS